MILFIARLLARVFGIQDITRAQNIVVIGLIALLGLGLLFTVLSIRSCSKRSAKIDLETVDKINRANEAERKKELQKVIEDNADTVRTVDNRSAIAETNVIERDRLIDEKVKEADKAIAAAKAQGRDVTAQELECLLIPENCN